MSFEFLNAEDVLAIHERQLRRFGGIRGVRDPGLLDSALSQPMASFGGDFLHEDVFVMAAAYLFHLVKNHPFLDGNKRTGLVAAIVFLAINGGPILPGSPELYEMTIAVAEGRLDKPAIARIFRDLTGASTATVSGDSPALSP